MSKFKLNQNLINFNVTDADLFYISSAYTFSI